MARPKARPTARPIALAGIGKIARDQHIPAITADPAWTLAATVSRNAGVDGVPAHAGMAEMLAAHPDIGTVSLALPAGPRFGYAMAAMAAGRHVMLEKPPALGLAECHALERSARDAGVCLFATWHSRMAHGVEAARARLSGQTIRKVQITWAEDVRQWHPGQDWVWQAGGMGVMDPGINALSILTRILHQPLRLTGGRFDIPAGRQTPIAAELTFAHPHGASVAASFDWRQQGAQTWEISVETTAEHLRLVDGGARLMVDGQETHAGPDREYPGLYRRMSQLVSEGQSDADFSPLVHVADAFMLAERRTVAPFDW